jgi:hypothetical protein
MTKVSWSFRAHEAYQPIYDGDLSIVVVKVLQEFSQIVTFEGVFCDGVPNRLGVLARYLTVGRSQVENQVIRAGDIPTGRCPSEDCERFQLWVPRGRDLADDVVLGRFLVAGPNRSDRLIDPVRVALQTHLHGAVSVIPGKTGEIVHDCRFLNHGPEPDLLYQGARDRLLLGAGIGQKATPARKNGDKMESNISGYHVDGLTRRKAAC